MFKDIFRGFLVISIFTFICGYLYPTSVTYLSNKLFYEKVNGSLLFKDSKDLNKKNIIGSRLIGQKFYTRKYFHPRPLGSLASNLGPTNKELLRRVSFRTTQLKKENDNETVPIDLITESASGIDPHISVDAAYFQVPRIARERGLSEEALQNIVKKNIENKYLGILGEKRINVLNLNLILDRVTQ